MRPATRRSPTTISVQPHPSEIREPEPARAIAMRRLIWTASGLDDGERVVAAETPVAIVHGASTTAVMMATPADLEDFAVGFTLTEGLADDIGGIRDVEIVTQPDGIEARVWLEASAQARLAARRRRLVGPTGCGLCGVESLAEARSAARTVQGEGQVEATTLITAMGALAQRQPLGRETRAAHAAGYWQGGELLAVREDVGRHNALDKLVGALARSAAPRDGVVLLTSRVSVEMVQKAASFGAPILCAVSAPTVLAVQLAEAAGLTLVAVCRDDGFEVFTHPRRIVFR